MSTEITQLAPHVEKSWADDFVVELRLRDVPGAAIGDVLTEVDAHVVDSGTSARDAFGDPVQYAVQIAETAGRPTPDDPREMVPLALGGAGLVVAIDGVVEWFGDGTVDVTGGTVALVLAVLTLPFVVQRHGTPLLRYLVASSFWRIWLLSMAFMGALVGLALLARTWHIGTLPAPPVAVAALALLAVTTALELRNRSEVDPLLAPGADRATADAAARRDARGLALVVTGIQVGSIAAAVGLAVLVTHLAG
ncbi:hypothetical protein [Cellulomonas sp. S1-8]|uniref:hypothetical protein n=1 Tax=Cellulomonas sp. S1-8 TaxID=2904790 RepID=UPI002242D06F|nr:hypothetical protein [Cellulomonas sp. S1-8]UZN02897.1 hypothetical protein OKX07_17870 [Cellulomonas sp. S1-8]